MGFSYDMCCLNLGLKCFGIKQEILRMIKSGLADYGVMILCVCCLSKLYMSHVFIVKQENAFRLPTIWRRNIGKTPSCTVLDTVVVVTLRYQTVGGSSEQRSSLKATYTMPWVNVVLFDMKTLLPVFLLPNGIRFILYPSIATIRLPIQYANMFSSKSNSHPYTVPTQTRSCEAKANTQDVFLLRSLNYISIYLTQLSFCASRNILSGNQRYVTFLSSMALLLGEETEIFPLRVYLLCEMAQRVSPSNYWATCIHVQADVNRKCHGNVNKALSGETLPSGKVMSNALQNRSVESVYVESNVFVRLCTLIGKM